MSLIRQKLSSANKLSAQEWCWFFLLYPLSGLARLGIAVLPFSQLSRLYGRPLSNLSLCSLATDEQKDIAWRIGRTARSVAKYTPWQCKCLVQALSTKALLRYYGIPHVLYFGARRTGDPLTPMEAHAWICVGPWPVTGRKGHWLHAVVATYVSGISTAQTQPN